MWMNIILQFCIEEADVNCQSLHKYEKRLWFYVFQYCMFFIQSIHVIQNFRDPPKNRQKFVIPKKSRKFAKPPKIV